MLIDALEYYIYRLKKDNCTQASIDAFTKLLEQIEQETNNQDGGISLRFPTLKIIHGVKRTI